MRNVRIALMVLLVVSASTVWAQVPTGSISGTVLDPQGLPVAGADVLVANPNTGAEYKVTSSDRGAYTVTTLPPGTYSVTVTAPGFKSYTISSIRLNPGTQQSVPPITLELGVVAETVTVEAGAELLNTTNSVVSITVENKQIQTLPLLDRSPLSLLDLQAGVNSGGSTPRVISGLRTSYANVTLDGVNIQDNFIRANSLDFLPNLLLINQVSEFTLISQNADPSFGFGAAQVAFSTPSGGNDWHGDVFWYHRNNKVAANDWFNNADGTEKPKLIQNQGGFGVGGPVVRDRLFVYGYWEIFRNREQDSSQTTVLTDTARNGIFTYIPTCTTTCPAGITRGQPTSINVLTEASANAGRAIGIDPIMASLLAMVPTTINDLSSGDGRNTGGFRFNQGSNRTRDNYGFKIDYNPSSKHSISGTWQWNRDIVDRPDIDATFNLAPVVANDDSKKFVSASWRWSPTPRFTNEARGGFNLAPGTFSSSVDFVAPVLTNTTLYTNPLEDFRPQGRFTDTYSAQDNASYVMGNHTFRFGGFFQRIKSAPFSSFNAPPSCDIGMSTFNPAILGATDFPGGAVSSDRSRANSLLASLAGFLSTCRAEFNVTSRVSGFVEGAITRRLFTLNNVSFFGSDSWRLRPNLTLNLGLRWEYAGRFDESGGLMLTPVLPARTTEAAFGEIFNPDAVLDFTGKVVGRPVYDKDLNNFGPQIGIAWDPWGNGKTSVRAGYSIHFVNDESIRSADNSTANNAGLNTTTNRGNLTITASQFGTLAFPQPTFLVPRTLTDQTISAGILGPGTPATIFTVDPKLVTPYVQQWNLSLQREIGWDTAVEVRYVGNHGVQLTRALDFNQVIALVGRDAFLTDFLNARNNAYLARAAGLGFNPAFNAAVPGSQPLPFFNANIFAGGLLSNTTIRTLIEEGRAGELAWTYHINNFDPVLDTGLSAVVPNPNASVADMLTNISTSSYHAGIVEVRRRPVRGIYFQANYTWSKVLTDSDGEGQTNFDPFLDLLNPSLDRARAEFDLTHVFKANFVVDLPFGRGQRFTTGNWTDKVIGGWSVGSIFTWQSGAPLSILSDRGTLNRNARSTDRNTAFSNLTVDEIRKHVGLFVTPDGVYVIDPQFVGNNGRGVGGEEQVCSFTLDNGNQALFCNPAGGTVGNLPRYAFNGPTYFDWNFSILKDTRINERWGVEFRAEFFNLLNHPTFFSGSSGGGRTREDINAITFGQSFATLSDRRIIQFGLRITF